MSFFVVSREAANNDRPVVTTEDASFKTQYYEPNPKSGVGPPPHHHTHILTHTTDQVKTYSNNSQNPKKVSWLVKI